MLIWIPRLLLEGERVTWHVHGAAEKYSDCQARDVDPSEVARAESAETTDAPEFSEEVDLDALKATLESQKQQEEEKEAAIPKIPRRIIPDDSRPSILDDVPEG